MSLTIGLQSIKCIEEVNEASASEEPYVLVTAINLKPPLNGMPAAPDYQIFRYGIWEDTDAGEVKVNGGPPFWGLDSRPREIDAPRDVAVIVSLMENDNGVPEQYIAYLRAQILASYAATSMVTDAVERATRFTNDIRDALNGIDIPFPFTLDDDHVGTTQLVLDQSDLIPFGSKEKTLRFDNAEGNYELVFRIQRHRWQQFELAPAGFAAASGRIASVSRIPGSMEVFWIGADGSVQDAFWYEGNNWSRFELAPAGSASLTGGISVVSRIPGSMEVFWIGADGSVQDAFWYEGAQWQRFPLAPAGSASLNGGIAAVSRIPNSMEVFWVGADGSVQDAFWYEGAQWQRFPLAPVGHAAMTSDIAVVSRVPHSMEVFWVRGDGSVQDAFWYEGA